jgi:polyphosphate glucokinase
MEILGVDIGGSGIKGALVDIDRGVLVSDRHRIATPQPAKPEAVAEVVAEVARHFKWQDPIGCTFPAIVHHGVTLSAANVHKAWIGADARALFKSATNCPVYVINDADAAGIAEMEFGAGKGKQGVVIMLTLGTGIGSAVFSNGILVPNTEFGHMEVRGKDAEHRAADSIRKEEDLSWEKWAARLNEFLDRMEALFSPDLFIIGGGVSKKHLKFFPYLEAQADIVPAKLRNNAGIVGAAMAAVGAGMIRKESALDGQINARHR